MYLDLREVNYKIINKGESKIYKWTDSIGKFIYLKYNDKDYTIKIKEICPKDRHFLLLEFDDGEVIRVPSRQLSKGDIRGLKLHYFKERLWEEAYVTNPDILKYASKEDIQGRSTYRHSMILATCPICGFKKEVNFKGLYCHGFSCPKCKDSINSLPEKIMIGVLDQLNIEYYIEVTKNILPWAKRFRYDFYIPSKNLIIEQDGALHFIKDNKLFGKLEDRQTRDLEKECLAKENGMNIIRIDCRKSDIDFIYSNILSSELSNIFDLTNIDLLKIKNRVSTNLGFEICRYWMYNYGKVTVSDVSKKFKIEDTTILKYIKRGCEIWDWCKYEPKVTRAINQRNSTIKLIKPVDVYKDGIYIKSYESAGECVRRSKEDLGIQLCNGKISAVIYGKRKTHGGHTFKHSTLPIEYFNNPLDILPNI